MASRILPTTREAIRKNLLGNKVAFGGGFHDGLNSTPVLDGDDNCPEGHYVPVETKTSQFCYHPRHRFPGPGGMTEMIRNKHR